MKYISHIAVLLTIMVSNTAMWGQISRTVSFDINSRHESDYCLGANTNEFTLTIDTKLESIDSLQAYDIYIRYDERKVKLIAGLKTGTISSPIPTANFSFRIESAGLAKVSGYLNFKAGNLVGTGALVAVRGQWLNSACPDSTVCKIEGVEPGFEFGIGPRYVTVDSSVNIFNRVIDTANTIVLVKSPKMIVDSIDHQEFAKKYTIKSDIFCGKATANDTVFVECATGDSITIEQIRIDSMLNVQATIRGNGIVITKSNRGIAGYVGMSIGVHAQTMSEKAERTVQFTSKATQCDCAKRLEGSNTTINLFRKAKPDTVTSVQQETEVQTRCTDYYDILGRFIESDCPNDESAKAIRRKAFKLGNDYIQYIETKK